MTFTKNLNKRTYRCVYCEREIFYSIHDLLDHEMNVCKARIPVIRKWNNRIARAKNEEKRNGIS